MSSVEAQEALEKWKAFWKECAHLITIYPDRPESLSGDAEAKKSERRLKALASELLPLLEPNNFWLTSASVGKGSWNNIPWVAFFDTRASRSAQQGVYPVIRLASTFPEGVRIALGVSATEFRSREDEKAAEVWEELTEEERSRLIGSGFIDVVHGSDSRIAIGEGTGKRKLQSGLVFERFAHLDELQSSPDELTHALQALIATYKNWADRKHAGQRQTSFLEIMQSYADERVVFMSPKRDSRYIVTQVTDSNCTVARLDSNNPEMVTLSAHNSKRDWLRERNGRANRDELEFTVAKQMTYLQSAEMGLASDRKSAVLLESNEKAIRQFIELVLSMQTSTVYKPVILALVIEGIRDGDLTDNHFEFDWLLPRFVERLKEHGNDGVDEQQLAEGFARMANDLFWLHAYREPLQLLPLDRPTPSLIRERVSHARLHEAYWQALQQPDSQRQVLDALAARWWPTVTPPKLTETDFVASMEQLLDAVAAKGFIFHPWQVATYVTALRTKPFVILAGISGTGKSKLPDLVSKLTAGHCERVSVRPDWTDSSEVLGYVDLNDRFRPGRVIQHARDAANDPQTFHVCLIDEMNLARVEHYFAEVLSAIEDRQPADAGGFQSTALASQRLPAEFIEWQEQVIPPNLAIVGTVNMDESSHGFSRKVLDRAFTIELSEVDLSLEASPQLAIASTTVDWSMNYWLCKATRLSEVDLSFPANRLIAERATSHLQEINRSLIHCQLQIGYRTRDEVILFMINAEEIKGLFRTRSGEAVDPLDLAVMMKVLPRLVGGGNSIRLTLMGLIGVTVAGSAFALEEEVNPVVEKWIADGRPDLIEHAKLPRSAARLCLMWKRLEDGYTSYWL